ncbi:hypothetical protein [Flavobacterium sp.]|uniref:hypothetical protein n=1 Tax=Flavobacterium sp. TaxID=239 RepID=UPI00374FE537
MRNLFIVILFSFVGLFGCQNNKSDIKPTGETSSLCSDKCEAKNGSNQLSCKLTSPEMQKRKETVLASLKKQILEKKKLKDGFAFKFNGSDKMIDELTQFIKTERECCDFFTFNLSISGDKSEIWLELKGKEGVGDLIESELGL